MVLRAVILSAMMVTSAEAACLKQTSLDSGVVVSFADGTELTIERHEGALLQLTYAELRDGRPDPLRTSTSLAWYGIFVVASDSQTADGLTRRYQTQFIEDPPVPEAGKQGELTTRPGNTPRRLLYGYSQADTVAVGNCDYQAVEVGMTAPPLRGAPVVGGHIYFLQLGFGFPGTAAEIVSMDLAQ